MVRKKQCPTLPEGFSLNEQSTIKKNLMYDLMLTILLIYLASKVWNLYYYYKKIVSYYVLGSYYNVEPCVNVLHNFSSHSKCYDVHKTLRSYVEHHTVVFRLQKQGYNN